MRMTPAMREANEARVAELKPIADRINKLMADRGMNSWFRLNSVEVPLHMWDREYTALSHVELEGMRDLSDDVLIGIIRVINNTAIEMHKRGEGVGKSEVRSGMVKLLGLEIGIAG